MGIGREIYWFEQWFLERVKIFVKECFTKEEIDKKNEDNLRIIKAIANCLSEYQIFLEEQLIVAYGDKYPSPINKTEIEATINKILKNFRSPFDEKEKNFIRNLLLKIIDKEIFVDERTYYFNLKTSINIPLLLEKPKSFIRNSKKINRFVVGIISRKIDPDFSKKCEIEERGQKIDLKTQLLARYQNNRCSIPIIDLISFSDVLNKLSQKGKNKFLISLDGWLFPRGNVIDSGSYYKGKDRRDKHFGMVVFVIFLFIALLMKIFRFYVGDRVF